MVTLRAVTGIAPATSIASPSPTATVVDTDDWRLDVGPLRKHLVLFLAIAVATTLIVGALTLATPKSYTATTKILVGGSMNVAEGHEPATLLPILNALVAVRGQQSAETYAELLQENPVAQRVIADLGLKTSPRALLASIAVKPVAGTNVLGVSVTQRSPRDAADIANAVSRVFVDRERGLVMDQADQALKFLSNALPDGSRKLRAAQIDLAAYEAKVGVPDISVQTNSLLARSAALDTSIGQASVDRAQASAQLQATRASMARMPSDVSGTSTTIPNPIYNQLRAQLSQLRVQLNTARAQYTDAHPEVVGLRHQIDNVSRELNKTPRTVVGDRSSEANPVRQQLEREAAEAESRVAAATAAQTALQTERRALDQTLAQLPAQASHIAQLKSRVTFAEGVYNELQQKYTEATVAKTTALSDVAIISPAVATDSVVRPNVRIQMLFGAVLGLVLGLVAVYTLELIRNTVSDARVIRSRFNLPVLTAIPIFDRLDVGSDAASLAGPAAETRALPDASATMGRLQELSYEAFLELAVSLRCMRDSDLRSLCITGPQASGGTSTVALNTAIVLAETGDRVLLIDANINRSRISTGGTFTARRPSGLSEVLAGEAAFSDAVTPSPYPHVDYLLSGGATPLALRLLRSKAFEAALDEAAAIYRYIVIDAPPLSVSFDAALIAEQVDGTILVVAAGKTNLGAMNRALQRLGPGASSVLGVVLNGVTDYDHWRDEAGFEYGHDGNSHAPQLRGDTSLGGATALMGSSRNA